MARDGFYRLENGTVNYAPNFVVTADYELSRETKDTVAAADGWHWYDDEEAAKAALGATDEQMHAAYAASDPRPNAQGGDEGHTP